MTNRIGELELDEAAKQSAGTPVPKTVEFGDTRNEQKRNLIQGNNNVRSH